MSKLNGRIAIVTGASRLKGIGAAACRALASEGADIFFRHWSAYDKTMPWGGGKKEIEQLQQELINCGVRAIPFEADLSEPSAVKLIFDEVNKQLGAPSILVNKTFCLD
jgi:3-oxoacyl-[acyl-carrier protein] reductase